MLKVKADDSFSNLNRVGFSLYEPRADQRHCGFLFTFDGVVRHLHLAWHNLLLDETVISAETFVDAVDLEDIERELLAAKLSTIRARNGVAVPYGLDCTNIAFDASGKLVVSDESAGLTCATFVAKIMDSFGFPMIKAKEWPQRDDDQVWQLQIVEQLRRTGNEDRAKSVERDIGAIRVRPEEVAGAGGSQPWPVAFENSVAAAQQILSDLAAFKVTATNGAATVGEASGS